MLTRALLLNPLPLPAPVQLRAVGAYVDGTQSYRVTYSATDRVLTLELVGPTAGSTGDSVPSAVSSASRAVVASSKQVAHTSGSGPFAYTYYTTELQYDVYSIGRQGAAAAPIASYPGYGVTATWVHGDGAYVGAASGNKVQIGSFIDRRVFGTYDTELGAAYTYSSGDQFFTKSLDSENGAKGGNTYDYPQATDPQTKLSSTALRILTRGSNTALSPLRRLTATGLQALAVDTPRVLDRANAVDWRRVVIGTASTRRPGVAIIPGTVETVEIDVEQDGDAYIVSKAIATWTGYIDARSTGARFVPLSVRSAYRTNVRCRLATGTDESYVAIDGPAWGVDTFTGQPGMVYAGLASRFAALFRRQDDVSVRRVTTVSTQDGTVIADVGGLPGNQNELAVIPHLDALVLFTTPDRSSSTADNSGWISFDGGGSWTAITLRSNATNGGQPTLRGAALGVLRTASPLFT